MAVNILTASAVAGYLSWGDPAFTSDGFTNGDEQTGVDATQLDATWFNAVQFEINYAIANGGIALEFDNKPDDAKWRQLGLSIALQDAHYRPRETSAATTYRTHDYGVGGIDDSFLKRERTDAKTNETQGTTVTFCALADIPNNSQFWVTYEAECIQTDSDTDYDSIIIRASCRKVGGTVTVQKTTTVDSDGGLGVTWSVVNSGGNPALRAALPAAPGKTFNLFAYARATNVSRTT